MGHLPLSVLILSKTREGSSYLIQHLEQHGYRCAYASSIQESVAQFAAHSFDLILSASPLHETDGLSLLLNDDASSVFFCFPVEDSCWWVPMTMRGETRLGAPAFRPSEFFGELDRMAEQIRSGNAPQHASAAELVA